MTCVYKEYEVKIKMVATEAMTSAKIEVFLGYNMNIVICWGQGNKNLVGGVYWGFFHGGGMSKFSATIADTKL